MNEMQSIWTGAPISWFRVSSPVAQKAYFTLGTLLACIKYAIEFSVVWFTTGKGYTPFDFVNPWLNSKAPFLNEAPEWLGLAWLAFTIPFVWIAISMSVRRSADIGISPWCGMLILIPLVNTVVMFVLAAIPRDAFSSATLAEEAEKQELLKQAYAPPAESVDPIPVDRSVIPPFVERLGLAILAGCGMQLVIGMLSVWVFNSYGFVLFFSSPVFAGAAAAFVYSGGFSRTAGQLFGMVLLMNMISFIGMLVIGLDGAICLIMALPILAPLSFVGAAVGAGIGASAARATLRRGGKSERGGMIGMMILLPLCLVLESLDDEKPIHSVTTSVVVQASPEVVWENVVAFPEITAEMPWLFRLGIAAPMRARIEGHGVGAIRHCEFTTGSFVEPITNWDPPHRLAFTVDSQPYPMSEWTPIPGLHPPHLEDGMRSIRGEFRLEPAEDGGTKLSGTTWYQLNVRPRLYWKCWADPVLHKIHRRVLEHIGEVSERGR